MNNNNNYDDLDELEFIDLDDNDNYPVDNNLSDAVNELDNNEYDNSYDNSFDNSYDRAFDDSFESSYNKTQKTDEEDFFSVNNNYQAAPINLGNLSEDDEPVRKPKLSAAQRAAKRRKRRQQLMIRRCVFAGLVIVFLVSAGMLINIFAEYAKAKKIYSDVSASIFEDSESLKNASKPASKPASNKNTTSKPDSDNPNAPTTAEEEPVSYSLIKGYNHSALVAKNSDSVGYLQIPAIGVLLPVVQGTDNDYYLNHAFTGEKSSSGTLFIDAREPLGIESQNTIIYGHNMKNGTMFGSLKKFMSNDFITKGENKYFYFYINNEIYKYEIYSVHQTPSVGLTYTIDFPSGTDFSNYISEMNKASYYSSGLSIAEDAKTITFSTCTNDDNTRFVVQGVRIDVLTN